MQHRIRELSQAKEKKIILIIKQFIKEINQGHETSNLTFTPS